MLRSNSNSCILLTDHLGNNRVVFRDDGLVVQENHYYAYGNLTADCYGSDTQQYKYNGKELDRKLGIDLYDYGARWYDATYDAWGQQTVTKNDIGFLRGYTGHEMMPEFKLINMNGRLYDPLLARFLSPDNYVQLPDFSQSLNRYSYCLNNPLKYTDPSGELFGLDDILVMSIAMGAASGAMNAMANGDKIWKGALIGAAAGAVSYGIGSAFGHNVGTFGHELLRAGAHGVAQGTLSYANGGNFGTGFATGFASSLAGSGAQALSFSNTGIIATTTVAGATTSATFGGSWLDGAMIGFDIGYYNHGWTTKYGDLTYELDEVTVYGHRPRLFRNFPVEKPLRAVYPEFDILVGIKGLFSAGREILHSVQIRNFSTNVTRFPSETNSFFSGARYTNRVEGQMWSKDFHGFPSSVDAFEKSGTTTIITGNDGIQRNYLQIPGSYRGYDGIFEYIKEPSGEISHRLFNIHKK